MQLLSGDNTTIEWTFRLGNPPHSYMTTGPNTFHSKDLKHATIQSVLFIR